MRLKNNFFALLLILLCSCNDVHEGIEGNWVFKDSSIFYNNKEVILAGVGITFDKDSCFFPGFYEKDTLIYGTSCLIEEGTYQIIKNKEHDYSIKISSGNKVFDGIHHIKFIKIHDKEGNLGLKLAIYSEKFYMEGSKWIIFRKESSYFENIVLSTENSPPPPLHCNIL